MLKALFIFATILVAVVLASQNVDLEEPHRSLNQQHQKHNAHIKPHSSNGIHKLKRDSQHEHFKHGKIELPLYGHQLKTKSHHKGNRSKTAKKHHMSTKPQAKPRLQRQTKKHGHAHKHHQKRHTGARHHY